MGRGADGPPPGPSGRGPDPPSIFRPERDWKGHNTTHQQVQLKARGRMLRLVDFNRLFLTYHPEIVLCCITGGGSMFRTGDEELDAIAESTRVVRSFMTREHITHASECVLPADTELSISPLAGPHGPAPKEPDPAACADEQKKAHGAFICSRERFLLNFWRSRCFSFRPAQDSYEQDGPPLGSGAFSVVVPVRHRITGAGARGAQTWVRLPSPPPPRHPHRSPRAPPQASNTRRR